MRIWGNERLVSLAIYCRLIMITAFRVKEALSKSITTVIDFSVRAAGPDWQWFDKLCLTNGWREKERQSAIEA